MPEINLKTITDKNIGELTEEDKLWLKENSNELTPHQKELYKLFLIPEEKSGEENENKPPETPPDEGEDKENKETPPGTGEGGEEELPKE